MGWVWTSRDDGKGILTRAQCGRGRGALSDPVQREGRSRGGGRDDDDVVVIVNDNQGEEILSDVHRVLQHARHALSGASPLGDPEGEAGRARELCGRCASSQWLDCVKLLRGQSPRSQQSTNPDP